MCVFLQIQQEIKRKERAVELLADKYSTRALTEDEIRLCLYSICDNNSFLNSNRYRSGYLVKCLDNPFILQDLYLCLTVHMAGFQSTR